MPCEMRNDRSHCKSSTEYKSQDNGHAGGAKREIKGVARSLKFTSSELHKEHVARCFLCVESMCTTFSVGGAMDCALVLPDRSSNFYGGSARGVVRTLGHVEERAHAELQDKLTGVPCRFGWKIA